MTKSTFTTLADGWKKYVEELRPAPQEYAAHKRAFYAGALTYDNILFNSVQRLGPDASNATIKWIHNEGQAFAQEQIALHTPNPNN